MIYRQNVVHLSYVRKYFQMAKSKTLKIAVNKVISKKNNKIFMSNEVVLVSKISDFVCNFLVGR